MNRLFLRAMRVAAPVMFAVAILVALCTVASAILVFKDMGLHGGEQISAWAQIAVTIAGTLGAAAMPFFGAAALWRADRWLAQREGASE